MEIQENQQECWSETDASTGGRSTPGGFSGPLSGPLVSTKRKNNKRSKKSEQEYVEITLDVRDDSVSVQNIRGGDPETAMLASRLEKRPASLGSQLSFKLRQVSHELRRMTSSNRFDKMDRNKSGAARALQGLKFISKNILGSDAWPPVELRFHELAVDGKLPRARFSQCIGTYY